MAIEIIVPAPGNRNARTAGFKMLRKLVEATTLVKTLAASMRATSSAIRDIQYFNEFLASGTPLSDARTVDLGSNGFASIEKMTWDTAKQDYVNVTLPDEALSFEVADYQTEGRGKAFTQFSIMNPGASIGSKPGQSTLPGISDLSASMIASALTHVIHRSAQCYTTLVTDSLSEGVERSAQLADTVRTRTLSQRAMSYVSSILIEADEMLTVYDAVHLWGQYRTKIQSVLELSLMRGMIDPPIPVFAGSPDRVTPDSMAAVAAHLRSDEYVQRVIDMLTFRIDDALRRHVGDDFDVWASRMASGAATKEMFVQFNAEMTARRSELALASWEVLDALEHPRQSVMNVLSAWPADSTDVEIVLDEGEANALLSPEAKLALDVLDIICWMATPFVGPAARATMGLLRASFAAISAADDLVQLAMSGSTAPVDPLIALKSLPVHSQWASASLMMARVTYRVTPPDGGSINSHAKLRVLI